METMSVSGKKKENTRKTIRTRLYAERFAPVCRNEFRLLGWRRPSFCHAPDGRRPPQSRRVVATRADVPKVGGSETAGPKRTHPGVLPLPIPDTSCLGLP